MLISALRSAYPYYDEGPSRNWDVDPSRDPCYAKKVFGELDYTKKTVVLIRDIAEFIFKNGIPLGKKISLMGTIACVLIPVGVVILYKAQVLPWWAPYMTIPLSNTALIAMIGGVVLIGLGKICEKVSGLANEKIKGYFPPKTDYFNFLNTRFNSALADGRLEDAMSLVARQNAFCSFYELPNRNTINNQYALLNRYVSVGEFGRALDLIPKTFECNPDLIRYVSIGEFGRECDECTYVVLSNIKSSCESRINILRGITSLERAMPDDVLDIVTEYWIDVSAKELPFGITNQGPKKIVNKLELVSQIAVAISKNLSMIQLRNNIINSGSSNPVYDIKHLRLITQFQSDAIGEETHSRISLEPDQSLIAFFGDEKSATIRALRLHQWVVAKRQQVLSEEKSSQAEVPAIEEHDEPLVHPGVIERMRERIRNFRWFS